MFKKYKRVFSKKTTKIPVFCIFNTTNRMFSSPAQRQPELPGRGRAHVRVLRARGRQPPVRHPHAVPQEPAAHVPVAPQPTHHPFEHQLVQLQLEHQEQPEEPRAGVQLHHLRATQRSECLQCIGRVAHLVAEQPVRWQRAQPGLQQAPTSVAG